MFSLVHRFQRHGIVDAASTIFIEIQCKTLFLYNLPLLLQAIEVIPAVGMIGIVDQGSTERRLHLRLRHA